MYQFGCVCLQASNDVLTAQKIITVFLGDRVKVLLRWAKTKIHYLQVSKHTHRGELRQNKKKIKRKMKVAAAVAAVHRLSTFERF